MGTKPDKNTALDLLVLDCRFDDEIASSEILVGERDLDRFERRFALSLAYLSRLDLTREIAVDRCEPGFDAFAREVVETHLQPGERADMGDAVPHLPGADHAD